MMTTKEIREKDRKALDHELVDRQKHLFDLRSQAVTEKLEDPSQLGKTRKEIARIKTVMRQREIEETAKSEKPETKSEPKAESKPKAAKPKATATAKKTKAKRSKAKAKSE
jgi:large subunit ribosomal protein L29